MTYLVTGAAGFIGFSVSKTLLARGETVIGLDIVNDYYDPNLKEDRVKILEGFDSFSLHRVNLGEPDAVMTLFQANPGIKKVIHLAAQAGVRHSLTKPFDYSTANLVGHLAILEACRHHDGLDRLVYASSSSVYGGNKVLPFSVEQRTDHPVSLYAATKKANELMSHSYAHLYGLKQVGLRFFTVYGPWGRPDMAMFLFADAIAKGNPIKVFNNGDMMRDFTFIDDIVAGVIASADKPDLFDDVDGAPAKVFNLGNNNSERLMDMITLIEKEMGREAVKDMLPMQPGDVKSTYADIDASKEQLGYAPTTPISDGIPAFIRWYKDYYKVN